MAEAGWYFKTLAAQEPGEDSVLAATFGQRNKNVTTSTHLLPFFGTDYGLCRYVISIYILQTLHVVYKQDFKGVSS